MEEGSYSVFAPDSPCVHPLFQKEVKHKIYHGTYQANLQFIAYPVIIRLDCFFCSFSNCLYSFIKEREEAISSGNELEKSCRAVISSYLSEYKSSRLRGSAISTLRLSENEAMRARESVANFSIAKKSGGRVTRRVCNVASS